MSETTGQTVRGVTRVRTLGDAVPVFRPFRDDRDDVKVVPKSADEIRAEAADRRDAAPMATSCGADGCTWGYSGTAGECREQAAAHRAGAHPELVGARTHRKGIRFKRRGEEVDPATVAESRRLRQERDDAGRLDSIERGRRARGEQLLEEVAAERLGPDGATSSSNVLEPLTEAEPEPRADNGALLAPAAPTQPRPPATPSGKASARTTTTGRAPMEGRREAKPRGYWTLEQIVAGFRRHHELTGETPKTSLLNGSSGPVPDYLPAYSGLKRVATYEQILEAAGLERPTRSSTRGTRSRRIAAAPPPPMPDPEPELPPDPEPELPPAAELELREAPPGHGSPLVRLLAGLTPELLAHTAGELAQLKHRLEAELALVDEAIDAQRQAA